MGVCSSKRFKTRINLLFGKANKIILEKEGLLISESRHVTQMKRCNQGEDMLLQTHIFELCNGEYKTLSELAQAMEISVSKMNQLRQGKCYINQEFIMGAIKAFPKYKLGDLFYFDYKLPDCVNAGSEITPSHN